MPRLAFSSGPVAGRRIPLEGTLIVGRENADVTIDDAELSRRHLRLSDVDGAVTIEDLDSLNGTFVDDRRIDGVTRLRCGETVRAGQSTFTLEPDPVPEPEPMQDPNATRISDIPGPPLEPGLTAAGDVAVAVPEATMMQRGSREEVLPTMTGDTPAAQPPPPAPDAAAPPLEPAPVMAIQSASVAAPSEPFGALAQGGRRRGGVALAARGGVATRRLAPAAAAILIIVATAVALVLYFGLR